MVSFPQIALALRSSLESVRVAACSHWCSGLCDACYEASDKVCTVCKNQKADAWCRQRKSKCKKKSIKTKCKGTCNAC